MLKILGFVALILGTLVILVATYHSVQQGRLAWPPLLLGFAAVLAGLLSLKKAGQHP